MTTWIGTKEEFYSLDIEAISNMYPKSVEFAKGMLDVSIMELSALGNEKIDCYGYEIKSGEKNTLDLCTGFDTFDEASSSANTSLNGFIKEIVFEDVRQKEEEITYEEFMELKAIEDQKFYDSGVHFSRQDGGYDSGYNPTKDTIDIYASKIVVNVGVDGEGHGNNLDVDTLMDGYQMALKIGVNAEELEEAAKKFGHEYEFNAAIKDFKRNSKMHEINKIAATHQKIEGETLKTAVETVKKSCSIGVKIRDCK